MLQMLISRKLITELALNRLPISLESISILIITINFSKKNLVVGWEKSHRTVFSELVHSEVLPI